MRFMQRQVIVCLNDAAEIQRLPSCLSPNGLIRRPEREILAKHYLKPDLHEQPPLIKSENHSPSALYR